MQFLSRSESTLRREVSAAAMIPPVAHVDEHVARTRAGDYVQTLRLSGASFESADDDDINSWHERLNVTYRNIGSPNIAIWTHVVRRRETGYPAGRTVAGFADEVERRYRQKMAGERLMVNELYLSVVYRPAAHTAWQRRAADPQAHRRRRCPDRAARLAGCLCEAAPGAAGIP